MNANELADMLKVDSWYKLVTREEIAAMLRQQQAEIETLKQIIDANNLSQNIGQFVKPANEPVAWAVWEGRPHDLFFTKEESDELCRLKGGDAKSIPLYTHPVKELTDEEILIVWTSSNFVRYTENGHIDEIFFNKFARAILRKAQEK